MEHKTADLTQIGILLREALEKLEKEARKLAIQMLQNPEVEGSWPLATDAELEPFAQHMWDSNDKAQMEKRLEGLSPELQGLMPDREMILEHLFERGYLRQLRGE